MDNDAADEIQTKLAAESGSYRDERKIFDAKTTKRKATKATNLHYEFIDDLYAFDQFERKDRATTPAWATRRRR